MVEEEVVYRDECVRLNIPISRIHLDPENPRLAEDGEGKSEKELLALLYRKFGLDELAYSMAKNGYFDEEPIVVVPKALPKEFEKKEYKDLKKDEKFIEFVQKNTTEFTVIEGNRRVATAKILLDVTVATELKLVDKWPKIEEGREASLKILPAIVYARRLDVIRYLGVRHIIGVKKWEPYAKAQYIVTLKEKYKKSIKEIQEEIGDRKGEVIKIYISYKLLEKIENETTWNTVEDAKKDSFSLLNLAVGQGSIKRYVGLPEKLSEDVTRSLGKVKTANLKNVYSFIYGEGKDRPKVIAESRDITDKLSAILDSKDATDTLISTRQIDEAYDRSEGEQNMVLKYLRKVNSTLSKILGVIHRHKSDEVQEQVEKAEETLEQIKKTIGK
jgi:hypothetical protein